MSTDSLIQPPFRGVDWASANYADFIYKSIGCDVNVVATRSTIPTISGNETVPAWQPTAFGAN
jgi:hypothetical protein